MPFTVLLLVNCFHCELKCSCDYMSSMKCKFNSFSFMGCLHLSILCMEHVPKKKNRTERQKIWKKEKNGSRNEAETTKSLNNHIHIHTHSPICEWTFQILCEFGVAKTTSNTHKIRILIQKKTCSISHNERIRIVVLRILNARLYASFSHFPISRVIKVKSTYIINV